jgi:hypothetical protein
MLYTTFLFALVMSSVFAAVAGIQSMRRGVAPPPRGSRRKTRALFRHENARAPRELIITEELRS